MRLAAHDLGLGVPGRTLVEGLTLELAPGSCGALLGRNGAGKSSLLHALAGLRACERGHVTLDGRPLRALGRMAVARAIGVLLQDEHESFWGSVADYVALGGLPREGGRPAQAGDGAVREALNTLDLNGRAGQPYRTLSGGERQRARIAQLLVQDPNIYLLDEPLAHLDLGHQSLVMRRFRALAQAGRTVLMALHEPVWAIRYCDQALLLYDSARFVHGTARDVLTTDHLEALYGCRLDSVALDGRTLVFPSA